MTKCSMFGASALILAIGVASASAEPFDPTSSYSGPAGRLMEGRAAAVEGQAPYYIGPTAYIRSSGPSSVILQEFHEGK